MIALPKGLEAYSKSPLFTQDTVPKGLLKNHNTKKGVWGVIHVTKGELEYTIDGEEIHVLTPEKQGIVEPEILHHVRPLEMVEFYVEFYK